MLSKNETTIGRDETVDIPLFGDNSVQRIHARIVKSGSSIQIRAESAAGTVVVNSQTVAGGPLTNGDIICIGKQRLRFSARRPTALQPLGASVTEQPQSRVGSQPNPTKLQVVAGPHVGAIFALSTALVTVGRAPDSGISLPGDNLVSRQHARLVWDGRSLTVEDCDSRNGVCVNGRRVAAQVISRGDEIAVGQSVLRAV